MDSGDLSYFSIETRKFFQAIEREFDVKGFGSLIITASNDINASTLEALNKQVTRRQLAALVICGPGEVSVTLHRSSYILSVRVVCPFSLHRALKWPRSSGSVLQFA